MSSKERYKEGENEEREGKSRGIRKKGKLGEESEKRRKGTKYWKRNDDHHNELVNAKTLLIEK